MMDFSGNDLAINAWNDERSREAARIASQAELHRDLPVGLRAALAVRIAKLALAVDHDAAGRVVHRHAHIAGRY